MRTSGNNTSPKQLAELLKKGEGQTLEFKRSTAELQGAMQSLCAFMNGAGGMVIIGVGPDGRLFGQNASDSTQQKIAAALDRFEAALRIFEERQGFLIVTFEAPIAEAEEKLLRNQSRHQNRPSRGPSQRPTRTTQFIVFWQFSRRVNCLPVNCMRLTA